MSFLERLFGDANKKEVSRYQNVVDETNSLESQFESIADSELTKLSTELKSTISASASEIISETNAIDDRQERNKERKKVISELLAPKEAYAYALVREAAKRAIGLRHYDVQVLGGAVLHRGQIAEMKTGEGKTLVASLPLYLNSLTGLGAHLVTVNDYLARRDAGWIGPVYSLLGLKVGVIGPQFSYIYDPTHDNGESDERLRCFREVSRQEAYRADITYGTNNEFGFDYLRDNMTQSVSQLSQRELVYAIVDEVDSILIDEARTPLIISAPSSQSGELYAKFAQTVSKLKPEIDFTVDEKAHATSLTSEGITKLEGLIGIENLYAPEHVELVHHVDSALKAYTLYHKNKEYVVKDGEIIIVDEFTGRMLHGRRYSAGLHQAIEAKEGVSVQEESVTLATITFQNYFRLYAKLSGMTGTAVTEAEEFSKIYSLEVVTIPTHRPLVRIDRQDVIFKTEDAKFQAATNLIKELNEVGQPVLVGTVSIAKSEKISKYLKAAKINHTVLNAKHHQKEGAIVAEAGRLGGVTVATNMAGRGVDIILGGQPPSNDKGKSEFKKWETDHEQIVELGGLFVIGTERHESRRIDNQLRGRAGRQGDPGVSQFFVSMDDDLMRIFGGEKMKSLMERLKIPDDVSINNSLLSKAIEQSQTKVETHNFDIRKQLVEYDDVMNKHREAIYRRRDRIVRTQPDQAAVLHDELTSLMNPEQKAAYEQKYDSWPKELQLDVERAVSLRIIDTMWIEHLKTMEALRESIGLRGYGQREPIVEYKREAYDIFLQLQGAVDTQIVDLLLRAQIESNEPVKVEKTPQQLITNDPSEPSATALGHSKKVGRNDPCPCGAVNPATKRPYKYKQCGLINATHHLG
ncbi:MAG: preprotein translocase subunit SecA [Candidatus Berkelbacteria bacterium]|nr:preprotein translocase subunit SecA [Candidatus Berkelbacteria bacterium]MCR4307928.1 preprotein translocase subunit SecA [Candidatus Berkelbacteria bacterium]